MAINYPTSLDSFTNPTTANNLSSPSHSTQHSNANDAVVAVETKVGTGASTPTVNKVLRGNGTGSSTWAQVDLTTDVTNTLPTANGGTGATNLTFPTGPDTLVARTSTDTLTNKTLTSPKVGTALNDTNGNPLIVPTATTSAVNGVSLVNGATGTGPTLSVGGSSSDTNADIILKGKGTGKVKVNAKYGDITSDTDGATVTFDMSATNLHTVTLGGNRTLAVSNVSVGQAFILRLVQDATGSRTVTWFTTIKWAGGSAPTLTTTASKADTFGFICTSSGNYDGYVVGQNL